MSAVAVWLGQQFSEVVGPGSNLCRVWYFNDFTDIYDFTDQNRDTPPPLTHKIFSIPEIFWKTGGFSYQVFRFGPVRQSFFRQYRDSPSLMYENFSIAEIFWNIEGLPHELFWHCETKSFRQKIVIPPPYLL